MKRVIFTLLLIGLAAGCDSPKPEPQADPATIPPAQTAPGQADGEPEPVVNPVKHEMALLSGAMHNSLDAIATGDLSTIPAEIAKVHPAKVATEAAVKAGTYTPPKNPQRIAEFATMDQEFHDKLRGLLKAAKQDDRAAAASAYGELVDGCVSCHAVFRP